jgi:hypothetical protein
VRTIVREGVSADMTFKYRLFRETCLALKAAHFSCTAGAAMGLPLMFKKKVAVI